MPPEATFTPRLVLSAKLACPLRITPLSTRRLFADGDAGTAPSPSPLKNRTARLETTVPPE